MNLKNFTNFTYLQILPIYRIYQFYYFTDSSIVYQLCQFINNLLISHNLMIVIIFSNF